MKILITGTAGFIGFHLVQKLANQGHDIWGIDSINDYYDKQLKFDRLEASGIMTAELKENRWQQSTMFKSYLFCQCNLVDRQRIEKIFLEIKFDQVIHLAAQPGVRYSLINPHAYIESNVIGFLNILEGCRQAKIKRLLYASSSSIYGQNEKVPFHEDDRVDHPISLYAASKKSNELMAYTYSHLFNLETIGLRFFTVYGPWGRPDMAPSLFIKSAIQGSPIRVFNHGDQSRDFTYIDDIILGIVSCLKVERYDNKAEVINIGNGAPVSLMDFISEIEKNLETSIDKQFVDAQPGDVSLTYSDTEKLRKLTGYSPKVNLETGIRNFVLWYQSYYVYGRNKKNNVQEN